MKKPRRNERGMGALYQPHYRDAGGNSHAMKTWWMTYSVGGRRVRESTGTADRKAALDVLALRKASVAKGETIPQSARKLTFERLCELIRDDYKENGRRSPHTLEGVLKRLTKHFAGWKASEITTDAVMSYRTKRIDSGQKPATINRELAALRRCFTLARERGLIGYAPNFKTLKENNTRKGFVERDAFERILSHLDDKYLHAPLRVAYLTGWRLRSEVLSRGARHFDRKSRVLRLEPGETKNGDGREFPCGELPELDAVIERALERHDALERSLGKVIPHLFSDDEGNAIGSLRKRWITACKSKNAGVPGLVPHDLRRSAVRNLERAGVARSTAMQLVGHRTESIYRRYAIGDETSRKEGVGKLAAFHAGAAAEGQKVVSLDERRDKSRVGHDSAASG